MTIPAAYLLDDFSVGLLWAARALDDALLEDDRPLAEVLDRLPPGDDLDLEGFVLAPGGTVLLANWLRADRLWHADVLDGRSGARSYRDAIGFSRAHSVIAADTPAGRLQRLADYLGLDWAWLMTRAAQAAAAGVDGLVRPRSRLLSSGGIEVACRFLAGQREPTERAPVPAA